MADHDAIFVEHRAALAPAGRRGFIGRRLSIGRDAAGRINAIVTYQNSGSAGQTIASSVTWHPFGPVSGIAFGNGLDAAYTLDTDYRITRVQVGPSGTPGGTLDRTLSWTGETINSITDNLFPGTTPPGDYTAQTQSFTYTRTRRLETASGYYGALSWTYDGNGNRTAQTLNGVTSPYAYPATSNRLASVTPPGGTMRNFTYDAGGNVKTDTRFGALGMSFEYDVEGRLSKAWQTNAPTIGGTYRYDARSRLVSRTVTQTAVATLYIYDLDDHIIAETDASGQTLREYIWLGDIPLAVVDKVATGSPVIYYVHADHLGRPARMTAQNQAWVWDVIYSPFGETSYIWTNPGTIDIRFPGQWFQLESGLHYNWHRHYDASLGRYVQPDPLGLNGGKNLYSYVNGNPFSYIDPDGQNPLILVRGCLSSPVCAGAIAGVATWLAEKLVYPNLSRLEQRQFDRYCRDNDDPCKAIKAAVNKAIIAAKGKLDAMLSDRDGLFGNVGWMTHGLDLRGRINNINAMIRVGEQMGCDMNEEKRSASELFVPDGPGSNAKGPR